MAGRAQPVPLVLVGDVYADVMVLLGSQLDAGEGALLDHSVARSVIMSNNEDIEIDVLSSQERFFIEGSSATQVPLVAVRDGNGVNGSGGLEAGQETMNAAASVKTGVGLSGVSNGLAMGTSPIAARW